MGQITIAGVIDAAQKRADIDWGDAQSDGGVRNIDTVEIRVPHGPDDYSIATFNVPDATSFMSKLGQTVSVTISYDD